MMRSLWVIFFLLHQSLADCPSVNLGSVAKYADGSFSYPNGDPQCFTQGSTMKVQWQTTYNTSNLYLIQNDLWNSPIGISLNTEAESYQWTVNADTTNQSSIFLFRVVNANGTAEQQEDGGFLSNEFFIDFTTTTTVPISTPTPTPTTGLTSSEIYSPPASASTTTTSTSTPTPSPTGSSGGGGSSSHTALSLGLALGLGIPFCIALVIALWLSRRKRDGRPSAALIPPSRGSYAPAPVSMSEFDSTVQPTPAWSGDSTWSQSVAHQSGPIHELG